MLEHATEYDDASQHALQAGATARYLDAHELRAAAAVVRAPAPPFVSARTGRHYRYARTVLGRVAADAALFDPKPRGAGMIPGEETYAHLLEEATRRDAKHNHNHYLDQDELKAAADVLFKRATTAQHSDGKKRKR